MSRGGSPSRSRAAGGGGRDTGGRGGPAGRELQVMAGVLFFTAGMTVLYWVLYFTTGAVQAETSEVYKAFEDAFPPADMWMSACAVAAGVGLLRRRSWALLFGLLAASALIFLGLMDVTYNINQDMYHRMTPEMVFEALINGWTLGLGALLIPFLWKRRHLFREWEGQSAAGRRRP